MVDMTAATAPPLALRSQASAKQVWVLYWPTTQATLKMIGVALPFVRLFTAVVFMPVVAQP
ncbi:MAG: hypothetical protein BWY56_01760 [Acidobacteria bacterium ADurb.Bin340]|nr:MAG: hypothetical protein BWY56_01760 [Acidobacteria bacterium ADurb.Bin340]